MFLTEERNVHAYTQHLFASACVINLFYKSCTLHPSMYIYSPYNYCLLPCQSLSNIKQSTHFRLHMNQNFYILIINVMVIYILVLLFQFMLQENIVKVSGVQISFRRFYQKSGIYCERTEHYVLFEVFPMVLFLLRLAQILIRLCFQFRVFVHFQFSATFFVFDVKFTVLKLLKPLMTTSPPNILRLCCGQTSNQRCQTH